MKVCIFRAEDGAPDFYRTVLPLNTAATRKELEKRELWISNILVSMAHEQEKVIDGMSSDIYFLQRISSENLIHKLRNFSKESGINAKLVMDWDDDVFNVSPLSNHYVDHGTEEIKIVHNGKLIHEWKDGVNINLAENRKRIDEIKRSCAAVDALTVTTEHLANVYRPYNEHVFVLPNCVDMSSWRRLDIRRKNPNEIRICWAGGHSHWEDLLMVRDVLKEIGAKYPNVKMVMCGYMPLSMEKDFRPGQIEFHPWVETPAHPYRMASLDIDFAVIPLRHNAFNQSKSTIKWLEFGSLEIPCVTSYVPPYDSIQDADTVNKGLFIENNDVEGWVKGISLMIENAPLRKQMGYAAYDFVKDNFDITTQYRRWIDAFKEVQCLSPATRT